MQLKIIDVNVYDLDRTLKGLNEDELYQAENDMFEEIKIQVKGIQTNKNPVWYNKENLIRQYYKWLSIRDAMCSRRLYTPMRDLAGLIMQIPELPVYNFRGLNDADLITSEVDNFQKLKFQSQSIVNRKIGSLFDEEALKSRYYALLAIRSAMYDRSLAIPDRDVTGLVVKTLISE